MRRTSSRRVVRDERVPIAAPDDLDDIPAGAAEDGFEFLNDLAVAANRAIEALQVAVDDEDEIVESFAEASVIAPSDSGSSISPSPRKPRLFRR